MPTAIETKYISATNTKGSRIKAACDGMSVTIPYDYSKYDVSAHFAAVVALKEKHKLDAWEIEKMYWGGTKKGYVFVFPFAYIGEK